MTLSPHVHSSHKTHYTLILILALLFVGTITYAQYTTPVPNPGHGATQVLVSINGTEVTLQQAIDQALLAGKAPGAPSIPNYTLDCLTSSTVNCPTDYVETGDDPDNAARCCRIVSAGGGGIGGGTSQQETILIGFDNNGNNDPDCWAISGSIFTTCGTPYLPPPNGGISPIPLSMAQTCAYNPPACVIMQQQKCVDAARDYYNSQVIGGVVGGWNVQSWDDTGDHSPCVDSSSDKLSVILVRS